MIAPVPRTLDPMTRTLPIALLLLPLLGCHSAESEQGLAAAAPPAVAPLDAAGEPAAPDPELCSELEPVLRDELALDSIARAPIRLHDVESGQLFSGCQVGGSGSFARVADPEGVLDAAFSRSGWTRDIYYAMDGPDGTGGAFRDGERLCLYRLEWVGHDDTDPDRHPEPPFDTWFRAELHCLHDAHESRWVRVGEPRRARS
jgi:hypothetical protein